LELYVTYFWKKVCQLNNYFSCVYSEKISLKVGIFFHPLRLVLQKYLLSLLQVEALIQKVLLVSFEVDSLSWMQQEKSMMINRPKMRVLMKIFGSFLGRLMFQWFIHFAWFFCLRSTNLRWFIFIHFHLKN